jgi:small-conductance mechanosensitive channel
MDFSGRTVDVIVATAVGIAAVVVTRFLLDRALSRYLERAERRDPRGIAERRTMLSFLKSVAVAVVAFLALWNVLTLFSATESVAKALLASSAVLALFAGLAFSTPLSNLGSGLLVAFTQPLRLGDRVTVGEHTGFVERINLIYSQLVTDDARRVFIPNSQLTGGAVVNRTSKDPRRTVAVTVPVALKTPIPDARRTVCEALATVPELSVGEIRIGVGDVSERSVTLMVSVFLALDADVVRLSSDTRETALGALATAGMLPE